jgi:hypothetical protein
MQAVRQPRRRVATSDLFRFSGFFENVYRTDARLRRITLKPVAIISAIVYAANAVHYGWKPSAGTSTDDLLAWLTCVALLGLYWAGYRILVRGPIRSFRQILLPAIPLAVLSFVTIPYDSTDVFVYMAVGRAQAHYGLNPYTHVLRDIPDVRDDPIVRADWMAGNKNPWLDLPFVYGFLFAILTRTVALIGGGHWWLTLGLLKLVGVAAYFVCARLLWLLSKALGNPRPDVLMYLFIWSPLILLHHIANVHNDLLVGLSVLLATYLMKRRPLWGPAILTAAAMLKFLTLPLIPLSLYFTWRVAGRRTAAAAAGLAGIVVAAVSLPYIPDLEHFHFNLISAQLGKTTAGSLYAFLFYGYRALARVGAPFGSLESFGFGLKIALWSTGAILILFESYGFLHKRRPTIEDWISTSSWILFVIIFVASSQFYSWYIAMWFPHVLLVRAENGLRSLSVSLSSAHTLSLTSLSRKGIGYFGLTLGAFLINRYRRLRFGANMGEGSKSLV